MSTRTFHQRSQHRSRFRRLALPAVAFGLTLAAQCSSLFETTFQSIARGEGPSLTSRKVEPRIVDFTKLAKLKAEARKLLDAARKAAVKGDVETAQRLADQAAAIPIEWNLSETSPKKFLAELAADPEKFTGSSSNVTNSLRLPNREVIELPPPRDHKAAREDLEDDLPAEDTATTSSVKTTVTVPPRSTKSTTPKSLQSLGFKNTVATPIAPEAEEPVPPTNPRYAPIPSLEELADTTVSQPVPPTTKRSAAPATHESPLPNASSGKVSVTETAPKKLTRTQQDGGSQDIRQITDDGLAIPTGRIEHSPSSVPFPGLRSQPSGSDVTVPATPAATTTVIHEIRVTDRPAPVDQAASLNSSNASQLLMNLNSLVMAGLFGALGLLIMVAVGVLIKFGPNPQFTFKVEHNHNHPLGVALPATPEVAPAEPIVKAAVPPVSVSPIYALKRQLEEELEQQQEGAMMRQVFEDNLKLREQIDETRIAA